MNTLKYQIDTEENRRFLEEIRDSLLAFGRRFPSPGGSSWYLGDDGTPWKDTCISREAVPSRGIIWDAGLWRGVLHHDVLL